MATALPDGEGFTGDVLSWLVRQACGEGVATCQRNRDSGRAREVHQVVTVSGARLVIRGEADESNGLDQEAWFLARARHAGVPVPEVLWLGVVETTAGPRTVMVQTAVAGQTLSGALPGMSAGERRSAARSCGQVIARLHSVRVGGFYRRRADGSFEFPDLAALQAADLANRHDNLRLLAGAGLLTPPEARRAEDLLPEAVAARGDGPAVLCHGELFPGHIFVEMGEGEAVTVTGLIDFGDACGGRPLDDLQSLCWEWPDVDRAALAAGYGPAPFWNDEGRRFALAQLRMLIGYTAHDLRAGKPADAGGYLTGLRALLAGCDGRLAFEPGERDRRRGRPLGLAGDLYPVHRLDAQKAVPFRGADQPREAGAPGTHGAFVLEREEHPLILRLLAGEHGGVLAGADRDIAGRVGGASEREQGTQPHAAPALAGAGPALSAVKVRDQLGIHQRAQLCEREASGPLDLATD
jgi:aminoglycoside phosphotransferase (APT) family kinase protein